MSSARDLVEAQAYERRRLVAAFVHGTCSDDELVRPLVPIVAGVVLALLVVVTVAVVTRV